MLDSAFEIAVKECENEFGKVEMESVDVKNDVELKHKLADQQVQDAQSKQSYIQGLHSKSNEVLAAEIEGNYSTGSIHRSNVEPCSPYLTESASSVTKTIGDENAKISQELTQVIRRHVQRLKMKPKLKTIFFEEV